MIIFITRFEPSDYARKFIRRHKPTQILSFKMSFPTFGLEVCIFVIPDEPPRLCKDIEKYSQQNQQTTSRVEKSTPRISSPPIDPVVPTPDPQEKSNIDFLLFMILLKIKLRYFFLI